MAFANIDRSKKALITGATSSIGRSIISLLIEDGWHLKLLSRERYGAQDSQELSWSCGDLLKPKTLYAAMEGCSTVIHLAALTHSHDPKQYFEVNVKGTENLLKVAQDLNVERFVYFSTRAAGNKGGPYCQSRLMAEDRVQKSGVSWVIFRPAEIFGGSQQDSVSHLVRTIRKKKYIFVLSGQKYRVCPVYIDDVTEAMMQDLRKLSASRQIYNLAGPEDMTFEQLVDRIAASWGIRPTKIRVPHVLAHLVLYLMSLLGIGDKVADQVPRLMSSKSSDNSLARKELNFNPRRLETALKEMSAGR